MPVHCHKQTPVVYVNGSSKNSKSLWQNYCYKHIMQKNMYETE